MANINEYTPASGLVVGADGKVYDVTKLLQGQDGDTGLTDDIRRYAYHGGLVVDSNGDVKDITQLIGGGGGGGGGERFVVNISYTGVVNTNAYGGSSPESFFDDTSCDKTVAEIKAAYDSGKNVVAVITITATGGEYEGSTFVKYAPLTRVEVLNMEWGNETRAYFGTSWTGYHHGYESGAGSYTTISTAYDALVLADDEDDPLQIEVGNPFVEYRRE